LIFHYDPNIWKNISEATASLASAWLRACNARSREDLTLVRARTTIYSESYFPQTTKDWNNLPKEMKDATSLEQFSEMMGRPERKEERYYAGTRRGNILHSRLRLSCSDLNSHLADNNLVESPACRCGNWQESVKHYLLDCSEYDDQRDTLVESIEQYCYPINTESLLYGSNEFSEEHNIELFKSVQQYILQTNRFK
jgi:hypothetical protein